MARAATASRPVAGQPGYDPFAGGMPMPQELLDRQHKVPGAPGVEQPLKLDEQERGPQAIQRLQRPEQPYGIDVKPPKECTAASFVKWLEETGMSKQRLKDIGGYAVATNPAATGKDIFDLLETEYYGGERRLERTVIRAGEELWGKGWTLQTAVPNSPMEEIAKFKLTLDNRDKELAAKNSSLASAHNQINYLTNTNLEQQRQINLLKQGRKPEELAAMGLDLGKNVSQV